MKRHGRRLGGIATGVVASAVLITALVPGALGRGTVKFSAGSYSGHSNQKDEVGDPLPLQLSVSKNKKRVTVVFFELSAPPCGGGGMGTLQYAGLRAHISNGAFKAKADPYGYVRGKFSGRKATGTALYEVHQMGVNCETPPNLKWSANHRGGG